jgi:hypothetical protein
MTISRTAIAAYLHTQFSALSTSIGQTASDASSSGYGADVDNLLRKLGKTESQLATATLEDSDRDAAFALGEYYTAQRLWRQLGDRVSHTMGETSYRFESQREQAKQMMDDAASRCAVLGYSVSGAGWSDGWLNLDFLEPETVD